MQELVNQTLANIVSEHNGAAEIFDKYHLDFCGDGNLQLEASIIAAGVNLASVVNELELVIADQSSDNINFNNLSIAELSEVIRNDYHEFLRDKISEISALSIKLKNGTNAKVMAEIHEVVNSIFNHLAPHMLSEEKVLFPYMEYMEHMVNQKKIAKPASFGKVKKTIASMLDDHKDSTDKLNKLRLLMDNYVYPEGASNDIKHFYDELRLLDSNLRMHIHIENNVLFKKARAMEQAMLNQIN